MDKNGLEELIGHVVEQLSKLEISSQTIDHWLELDCRDWPEKAPATRLLDAYCFFTNGEGSTPGSPYVDRGCE